MQTTEKDQSQNEQPVFLNTADVLKALGIKSVNTVNKYFSKCRRKVGSRVLWSLKDIQREILEKAQQ